MSFSQIISLLVVLVLFGYFFGHYQSKQSSKKSRKKLHSLPKHYGYLVGLWTALPSVAILLIWTMAETTVVDFLLVSKFPSSLSLLETDQIGLLLNEIRNLANSNFDDITNPDKIYLIHEFLSLTQTSANLKTLAVVVLGFIAMAMSLSIIKPKLRARNTVEKVIKYAMIACATLAVLTTVGIVLSVAFESIRFFQSVPILEFLFGTHWSPQTAIRADQVGSTGGFGAIPLFTGTLLISFISLLVAVPLGLMSAIYLSQYASQKVRSIAKPLLEILAGVPTVVYGFFAAVSVAPFIRDIGEAIGLHPSSESALAAGFVMGVMIIPFVSSLSDDVISAVPNAMTEGSLGMGATRSETVKKVILPAALPGVVGSILLAASRAIGETMIVVMAAGLAANLTANPLEAVTTVTVQIVTLLTGDQEFDSPKTLAAFALGLSLFVVTLILNIISLKIVRKYREQYE